jgi:hypothetical protein
VKKAIAITLALSFFLAVHLPASARARLIAVFPLRSTADLAPRAIEATRTIVTALSSIEGFDARLVHPPRSGTLGMAAAAVGAEFYVVGQLVKTDTGYQATLGSFQTATDKQLTTLDVPLAQTASLPPQPAIGSLVTPQATPSSSPAPPANVDGIEVTAGLPVAIRLDAPLSSSSAKVGDTFAFQASADITSGGFVVIPKGSQGQGEVVQAESAGGNGHPGKLGLQFDWIVAADGAKVKLSVTPRASEGEGKGGAA